MAGSGVKKTKPNPKPEAKSKPRPIPSPPRLVPRSIQPLVAGTRSISGVGLARTIQGLGREFPAMKRVREQLAQLCNDGIITEGQYNMLEAKLKGVLAPIFANQTTSCSYVVVV